MHNFWEPALNFRCQIALCPCHSVRYWAVLPNMSWGHIQATCFESDPYPSSTMATPQAILIFIQSVSNFLPFIAIWHANSLQYYMIHDTTKILPYPPGGNFSQACQHSGWPPCLKRPLLTFDIPWFDIDSSTSPHFRPLWRPPKRPPSWLWGWFGNKVNRTKIAVNGLTKKHAIKNLL